MVGARPAGTPRARFGISDRVRFWGQIPGTRFWSELADCDVLLHPTLHDSGGWVSLEAMAAGRPVICLDLGGPAMEVTEETGFKIPPITPRQAIEGLATALLQMARDADLKRRMGEAGRKRVQEHFNWDMKGDRIARIYDEVRTASRIDHEQRASGAWYDSPGRHRRRAHRGD
jgi:glycosyltransferase involved in cell wall biosynthesis